MVRVFAFMTAVFFAAGSLRADSKKLTEDQRIEIMRGLVAEYAKADAEDLLIRISVTNRGPEPAAFDLLRLHRIEAACIPTNIASVKLLEKTGFQREGYARQYLCINGIWQDHLSMIDKDPAHNTQPEMIANLEEGPNDQGHWIHGSVAPDGTFTRLSGVRPRSLQLE